MSLYKSLDVAIDYAISQLGEFQFQPIRTQSNPSSLLSACLVRAVHVETRRKVIFKFSQQTFKLENEYFLLRQLSSHPNGRNYAIAPAYILLLNETLGALIYDDPGPNILDEWLGNPNPLDLKLFLKFALGVSYVLCFLHEKKIVHGEIRLDTFHYDLNAPIHAKLLTIGSSVSPIRFTLSSLNWKRLYQVQNICHKLQFFSPEQIGNVGRPLDSRSDIYSLGILFYVILTKQYPWGGQSMRIVQSIHMRQFPSVLPRRPDAFPALDQLIQKMTAKSMNSRISSATDLCYTIVELMQEFSTITSSPLLDQKLLSINKPQQEKLKFPKLLLTNSSDYVRIFHELVAFSSKRDLLTSAKRVDKLPKQHLFKYRPVDNEATYCQVVTVTGEKGSGKSNLLNAVADEARKFGYFAMSSFKGHHFSPYSAIFKCVSLIMQQTLREEKQLVTDYFTSLWEFLGFQLIYMGELFEYVPELNSLLSPKYNLHCKRENYFKLKKRDPQQFRSASGRLGFMVCLLEILSFTSRVRPVIIILDELHLADHPSLSLIIGMISHRLPILLILAWDEPVMFKDFSKCLHEAPYAMVTDIRMNLFDRKNITEFLDSTLESPTQALGPLVLLMQKLSKGNPLVLKSLLLIAFANNGFAFHPKSSSWTYDLPVINRSFEALSSYDIPPLLASLLDALLPARCIEFLLWAALLVEPFPFELLRLITTSMHLFIPKEEILDFPLNVLQFDNDNESCQFSETFFREGILSKISLRRAESMHAQIAKELITGTAKEFYDIRTVHHILKGLGVIKKFDNTKPYILALKESADALMQFGSYEYATELLKSCLFLLPRNFWNSKLYTRKDLISIHISLAMCYWWSKDHENAIKVLKNPKLSSSNVYDYLPAFRLLTKIEYYKYQSLRSIDKAQELLSNLGLKLKEPTDDVLREFYDRLSTKFLECDFLVKQSEPLDRKRIDAISVILSECGFVLFNFSQPYYYYFSFLLAEMYLRYGNPSLRYSVMFLASYCFVTRRKPEFLLRISQVDSDLFVIKDRSAVAHAELIYWGLKRELCSTETGSAVTLESILLQCVMFGDKIYGAYCLACLMAQRVFRGDHIHQLLLDQENSETLLLLWDCEPPFTYYLMLIRNSLLALFGLTNNDDPNNILTTKQRTQKDLHDKLTSKKVPCTFCCWYYAGIIFLNTLFHHYEYVMSIAQEVRKLVDGKLYERYYLITRSFIGVAALQLLFYKKNISEFEREKVEDVAHWAQSSLSEMAKCFHAELYKLWVCLLEGLRQRNLGNYMEALRLFEKVTSMGASVFSPIEFPFVLELIGEFYYGRGHKFLAKSYITRALSCLKNIGCYGVENKLRSRYSDLISDVESRGTTVVSIATTTGDYAEKLKLLRNQDINDFSLGLASYSDIFDKPLVTLPVKKSSAVDESENDFYDRNDEESFDIVSLVSVIKCGQLLSSKLRLGPLLTTVIKLVIEYSQAKHAAIILKDASNYTLAAHGNVEKAESFEPPVILSQSDVKIPDSLLSEVFDHCRIVSLYTVSASQDAELLRWLQEEHDMDFFAIIPLQFKESVIGALYLCLSRRAIRTGNVTFLKLLSQQIAISVSNALLFQSLRRTITDNVTLIELQRLSYQRYKAIEEKCITLLDSLPCIVWTLDSDIGEIEYTNASKRNYFGVPEDCHDSLSWKTFIHPDHHHQFQEKLLNLKTLELGDIELLLRMEDGNYHWHLCRGLSFKEDANAKKWIVVCIDINDEKEAREAAMHAVNLKTNFLANMSHELRTPFSSFYGMLSLLSDTKLNEEQYDIVSTAKQSCTSLVQIIDDLLNFSELKSGKMKLEPDKVFDVEENIADCIELVYPSLSSKPVQISYDIYPNVPALLAGDSAKLRQVITNLLGNSVKFTTEGHILLRCMAIDEEINAEENQCKLRFEIEDTGIGLKEEQLKLLFNPFTQVDGSTTRIYGGSGLGLSICLQICKIMDGDIGVQSVYGEGSTFWFHVQLRNVTSKLSQKHFEESHERFANIRQSLKNAKILVVKSFTTSRSIFRSLFSLAVVDTTTIYSDIEQQLIDSLDKRQPYDFLCIEAASGQTEQIITQILSNQKLNKVLLIVLLPSIQRTKVRSDGDPFITSLNKNQSRIFCFREPIRISKLLQNFPALLSKWSTPTKLVEPSQFRASPRKVDQAVVLSSEEKEILQKKYALIAEDNLIARKLLTKQLSNLGFQVHAAVDGVELVKMYEAKQFGFYSVIFADYHMPIRDGAEAVMDIRAYERENNCSTPIPVIALTADIQKSAKQRCLEVGMNFYLTKPFTQKQLVNAVREFVLLEKSAR
ncbi:phosphorelay sensor kinase Mak2 [Schizosaccharomyces pombe]|uniref:Peroxide stress-activated histidine kinase mak2 n=1 Tax=Schizosaccharomyces pombe (strain 972 / ATCC 24843) TaxID=284812 RepID=MAK2_SCHPO|nr:histidine kinase Mak2 [Schizosaccharomyces pombe]O14002.1 RecName: Full=Peroxide stress-activated histidine kinase mak2; AltName: Full=His-Asp phosphorelay kinase phk1; AltName: Full=Mcs4-associated kinase 2 [Schizosaccharomyces pombe 972h-]CAB11683.1 histidine kinase Mak2 [Schizosaccharomyces pombe]|eukprot:NP_594410.1 histidine kinase Mak2 [Schizosaccharomyces pombe]